MCQTCHRMDICISVRKHNIPMLTVSGGAMEHSDTCLIGLLSKRFSSLSLCTVIFTNLLIIKR